MNFQTETVVTWIQVAKPTFDIVRVVLSSFWMACICAAVASTLGIALGIGFIVRRRRQPESEMGWTDAHSLRLLNARRP